MASKCSAFVTGIFILAGTLFLGTGAAFATALADFDLIALGNVTGTSEVEGRAVVFGNILGDAKNFAIKGGAVSRPVSTTGLNQTDGLIVGGQIQSTVQVNNGGARIGGASTGSHVNNADYVTYNDAGVPGLLAGIRQDLNNFTAMLDGLTTDSVVDLSDMNLAKFWCAPGDDGISVFNVDAATFFSRNGTLDLTGDLADTDLIVIKVSGNAVADFLNMGNEFLSVDYQSKIVWYMPDAVSLVTERMIGGSVIAPNADITLGNYIAGTVVGQNITLTGEIHLPTLNVPDIPSTPTPEPGTLVLLGVGMLLLGRRPVYEKLGLAKRKN